MKNLNIIESILILIGLLVFGIGSKIDSINQAWPWLKIAGLGLVFVVGLSDAIYRLVTRKSFLK
ncbi:hypothetical protein [Lactiplantibacillus mudanjiangensis]|uniref:DUF378 domain-containing protein n=1 Tax=Lactiplantibacillus mudanjiangensis TaxID=1296538 RepID=A0A660E378_9LACO|nr:hypothetical protein [Lactiplantibacillus mudanjiangensis]VDG19109.1 hypothetical protein [Lactobacillus sp. CBA3605] [Lactiplantibacillus mudanjiangensis]VDG23190.1 hypothetical protein [Lactobacillus sp. CBA3605] [Lactiplantibacillus mudanjiangensis]VDG29883.1 hypothetical protein [Lactobacillus sp. CBA3605] [Lactiplantibacillus mudanjiangensis]VDG33182.1 hypothetical protein [Lactobacillus sp. CBA3605] [Lactiplantibacillus mudanjiangensis]